MSFDSLWVFQNAKIMLCAENSSGDVEKPDSNTVLVSRRQISPLGFFAALDKKNLYFRILRSEQNFCGIQQKLIILGLVLAPHT